MTTGRMRTTRMPTDQPQQNSYVGFHTPTVELGRLGPILPFEELGVDAVMLELI